MILILQKLHAVTERVACELGLQLMVPPVRGWEIRSLRTSPRVWSEKRQATFTSTRSYDPAPDGNRVVALMPAETPQEPPGHLIFLLNFFDELRRRAPVEPR
jgi:hypothetical protein